MLQELNVFNMIVRLIGSLELLLGFPWVNTLEDTKTSEVRQFELKLSQSLGPSNVLSLLSFGSLLYFLSHLIIVNH